MTLDVRTPWHKTSFDRLLHERLPQRLAERLPLIGYHVTATGRYTCRVQVTLSFASTGAIDVDYTDVPQPDDDGFFEISGERHWVVPIASSADLESAAIRCVGEQVYDYIAERLAVAPGDLPWDTALVRAWLPLDTWIHEFMQERAQRYPYEPAWLRPNWLEERDVLRRLYVHDPETVFAAGQIGRTCPFETPEGPNIGRILHLAVGAAIRDGRLVVVDDCPAATLGLEASMIPFLEYNTPTQLLLGANMLRQWITPPHPEPAVVQTGNEPAAPAFWCGRNVLTAFVSWGPDTCEDGILLSASAAKRLGYPFAVEPGDKLSNRHGTKGIVSRILSDDEMPHLADGTPVELVVSFIGLHTRMSIGALREAMMSRIARAEGAPAVVPPFEAPREPDLCRRLAQAGLPASGMETLTLGRGGPQVSRPSTVGWVYWGRLYHLARGKVQVSVEGAQGQRQGEPEFQALRDAAAWETIAEQFNTRAAGRDDAGTLAARVAAGPLAQAGPPTPQFAEVVRRLAQAGIRTDLADDRVAFRFAPPEAETAGLILRLAQPVPHPWLRERALSAAGAREGLPEYDRLAEANARLERMLAGHAPASLVEQAQAHLAARASEYCGVLLTREHLRFQARVLFSGRAVLAPGAGLRVDQVGVAEEIAWTLFGPLVARDLGDHDAVRTRSEPVTRALDAIMARSWLVVHRAPSLTPTAFLALRPVRDPDRVIRLHPLICPLLGADFDGDQAAVFLPLTEGAQREAGARLSIAGHLARDPNLLTLMVPAGEALWGLASLSLSPEGRREITHLAGAEVAVPEGYVTHETLAAALRRVLEREGTDTFLAALERLHAHGVAVTRESGASMSPFIGATLDRPAAPEDDAAAAWDAYAEEIAERLAARTDFARDDHGPQLLAVKSGARGDMRALARLVGPRGTVRDARDRPVIVRHGHAQGLVPEELYALAVGAREELAQVAWEWERAWRGERPDEGGDRGGFGVLARARRAQRPGFVFALAAATGESDPLADRTSRLFVGLLPSDD